MDRQEVVARRVAAQQLDREPAARPATDAAVLDLGVRTPVGTGPAGRWSTAGSGSRARPRWRRTRTSPSSGACGAPHHYRRADLRGVLDATSPYDDADARKRTFDASRPLTAAGIGMCDAMDVVATTMRDVVVRPTPKGELSAALTERLPEPYLRWCRPCSATHVYEQTFRLAALAAGLELEPGTSPPVLRRIPGWRRAPALGDPTRAPGHLRVVDAYARLCGPTTAAAAATFLDAPPSRVKEHWPEPAPALPEPAVTAGLVRLLGPFDLLLQARDREVLVPDRFRHKTLWPTIGRPGAVLVGTELAGTWRPKAAGKRLTITVEAWQRVPPADRAFVDEQAERLAAHRGVALTEVVWS